MFEKIKTIIGLLFLGLILSAVVMMTEIVPTRVNGSDISLLTVIFKRALLMFEKYHSLCVRLLGKEHQDTVLCEMEICDLRKTSRN